jgi:hypothetical protein
MNISIGTKLTSEKIATANGTINLRHRYYDSLFLSDERNSPYKGMGFFLSNFHSKYT